MANEITKADSSAPPPEGTGACYCWTHADEEEYLKLEDNLSKLRVKRQQYEQKRRREQLKSAVLMLLDTAREYVEDDGRHCDALVVTIPRGYRSFTNSLDVKITLSLSPEQGNLLLELADCGEITL